MLLSIAGCAEDHSGKTALYAISEFYYKDSSSGQNRQVMEYDEMGNMTRQVTYNGDTQVSRREFQFRDGKMTADIYFRGEREVSRSDYTYGQNGDLTLRVDLEGGVEVGRTECK